MFDAFMDALKPFNKDVREAEKEARNILTTEPTMRQSLEAAERQMAELDGIMMTEDVINMNVERQLGEGKSRMAFEAAIERIEEMPNG
jgi:hypothetical protein